MSGLSSAPGAPALFNDLTGAIMTNSKSDYPTLECPLCGVDRKPRSLNKDGSVTYSCPPDHVHHGNQYTWRIAEDGSLLD